MIDRELPVTRFIDGIINGLVSKDESECHRHESIYEDAFRFGYQNKGNSGFIEALLHFWLDYVKFMQSTEVVVSECDLESCEICSTEDIDDDSDEECDCHFDEEPDQDTDEDDEVD